MSSKPNHNEPDEPTEDDPRLKAYLFELLDIGAAVAQSVKRQADLQAQPTPEGATPHPTVDVADQFERVARAMRRTVLLIRHLAKPRHPARHRTQARKRIIREVEDAIQREYDPPEAEPIHAEFRERLDAPDLDDDIDTRPINEIVDDISRDLGLGLKYLLGAHPWERRTPRDLAALTARAEARRPPGPYDPAPHGPDPGAPIPEHPRQPFDHVEECRKNIQLLRLLDRIT